MGQDYIATVAIIGAGPAGTAAAIHLGQLGIHDIVLVDRHDFPRHKTCGSGVSPKGIEVLRTLGVWDRVAPEAYEIIGLRLVTPGGREAYISGGDKAAAIICCRRTLDYLLLQRAMSLGTRFLPDFDAQGLIYDDDRVAGFTARDGRTVRARYTLIANGAHSTFTVNRGEKRLMQAIMGWWNDVPFEPNHVEKVFDRMLAPCYGWLFPENANVVNIGICYEDPGHEKNARTIFGRLCATSTANSRKAEEVRNCLTDEGRPLGVGLQEQTPNHLRRLWPKATVVNAEGKGSDLPGQVTGKKRTAKEPLLKCRKYIDDGQNRGVIVAAG